jgi:hypothetical protein
VKLIAIGLAVALACGVATQGQAQMPPGAPYGPAGPGLMPPGAPPGMVPGPGYALQGPYPGMQPVMPVGPGGYGPPGLGDCGCGEPCGDGCGWDSCERPDCGGFGRFGTCCEEGGLPGCLQCPCDGGPCWRVRVETILMELEGPDRPATTSLLNGVPVLGIRDLEFDTELTWRLTLERRIHGDCGLEISFLVLPHWSASAAVAGTNLQSPYQTVTGNAVPPYDNATQHDIGYSSDLFSFEFNYWVPVLNSSYFQASLLAGGRYLHIEEDFSYGAVNNAGRVGSTNIHTSNIAPGVQLGCMAWIPLNRQIGVRFDGKAAALYNLAEQETNISAVGGTQANVFYSENPDTSKASFLGEMSLVAILQVNCHVGVFAGYQAMFVDELVLAPEQFNPIFPTGGVRPVLIDDRGHRAYHGFVGGLELTW